MKKQPRALVLQSHRNPLPYSWLSPCIDSVKTWAEFRGFDYRFIGDELFDLLDADLRIKLADQIVIASDLARLLAMQDILGSDYDCVIWCDADFLIYAPEQLSLGEQSYGFGREVWVQKNNKSLKVYKKVHNAFMFFRSENPFLDFYIDSIRRMLTRHEGAIAPQFAGPKFLSAINNITALPVIENAGMLSPLVIADVVRGGGDALDLFLDKSSLAAAGVNLCSSLLGDSPQVQQAIDTLSANPELLSIPH